MNRRSFIKGVMATAAGGALALVAKESIAAAPPQATVLAGESGVIHPGEIAEPHPITVVNGGTGYTGWVTSTPYPPQSFPAYDDWCGMYVDHALDAMQYAHPQSESSMQDSTSCT